MTIAYTAGPLMAVGITGTSGGFGMNFSWTFSTFVLILDFKSGESKIIK